MTPKAIQRNSATCAKKTPQAHAHSAGAKPKQQSPYAPNSLQLAIKIARQEYAEPVNSLQELGWVRVAKPQAHLFAGKHQRAQAAVQKGKAGAKSENAYSKTKQSKAKQIPLDSRLRGNDDFLGFRLHEESISTSRIFNHKEATTKAATHMSNSNFSPASSNSNTVTEQLTAVGRAIEHDSFAIIDQEAGAHSYSAEQWPIVRRMIHANADFDFNGLTRFHPQAVQAGVQAMLGGASRIVADVEMICVGLSKPRLAHFGMDTHHYISDADVIAAAHAQDTTRAVQAMRKAHRLGMLEGAIVGVGNAPTALLELIRLVREEGARPALIVGMPVGFVSAAESKELLEAVAEVPWISITGRKGGSTLVVAAIHALLALAEAAQRQTGKA